MAFHTPYVAKQLDVRYTNVVFPIEIVPVLKNCLVGLPILSKAVAVLVAMQAGVGALHKPILLVNKGREARH